MSMLVVRDETWRVGQAYGEPHMTGAREVDLALLMADLCGYTALTETHGALAASETVLRFVHLARSCLETGVVLIDSIGDAVFCAGEDTLAVVRTAIRLRDTIEREPEFPRASMAIHRGPLVEREGRLFGTSINLTARLVAHAPGGQILCTEPIARVMGVPGGVVCRPIGARHFKNVIRSVALFELSPGRAGRAITFIDPVCRMQVTSDGAAAAIVHQGETYRFCSAVCARLFADAPGLYVGESSGEARPSSGDATRPT
jgi:adenylate cyclase